MVKQIYGCEVCNEAFEKREEAEKHKQIPIKDPFPIGLILKWNIPHSPRFPAEYGVIISAYGPEPHRMHEMIYKFYSFSLGRGEDFDCISDYTASDIRGKIPDSLSELTEEEFRTLNLQWGHLILQKVFHSSEKGLIRTVPSTNSTSVIV